ncbi:hypothetical protein [Pseudoalteromonas rhizosphaerae]|uniref:hypothetical protein n=1 Tax=Pseudoalteromonas rhizosphaerae TaxID=2518973 RepID=UPI00384D665B
MAAFTASQASVTNGSKVVTINSGESIANIRQGDFLFLAGFLVEINRGYVGAASQQYIELVKNWANSSQSSQPAVVIPTTGDFRAAVDAINNANKNVNDNFVAMQDWQTKTGTVTFTNQDGTTTTVKTLKQIEADNEAQMDAYHPFPWAMRKVEFEARRAANNEKYAASGFVHFGKHYVNSAEFIKEGITCFSSFWDEPNKNRFWMGRSSQASSVGGASKTDSAILNIAGVITNLESLADDYAETSRLTTVKLPPVEDGTRTCDSATGVSVTHATAAIAFASETATNKVVTNRVDMWGFEAFLREINAADPFVYKHGLIQSLATSINGVPTVDDNVRPITYFAWYEGDTTSRGKGVNWQTATESQRIAIASDADNKIYFDDATGKFYQMSIRGRSFAGTRNGDWLTLDSNIDKDIAPELETVVVAAQGIADYRAPYVSVSTRQNSYRGFTTTLNDDPQLGVYTVVSSSTNTAINGECYFLVCGTVNRRNTGLYHESFNNYGTAKASDNKEWHETTQIFTSKSDCFDVAKLLASSGSIASAKSGAPDGRFYDAIYASGAGGVCRDMRYSAYGLSPDDFTAKDAAIKSAEYRGREKAIKSKVIDTDYWLGSSHSNKLTKWINYSGDLIVYLAGNTLKIRVGDNLIVIDKTKDIVFKMNNIYTIDASTARCKLTDVTSLKGAFPEVSGTNSNVIYLVHEAKILPSVSGDFLHTDIIGDPSNILLCEDLKDGWAGLWVPVIPDGVSSEFPLSRPRSSEISSQKRIYTSNNGQDWTVGTVPIDIQKSETVGQAYPAGYIGLLTYNTKASLVKSSINTEIYGGLGYVFASSRAKDASGRVLGYSLTKRVNKSLTGSVLGSDQGNHSLTYIQGGDGYTTNKLLGFNSCVSQHTPIAIVAPQFQSPAFKALNYNVVENQQGYVQYAATELKHNGVDWGDDGKIHIVDNQSTMLDENGNTVLVVTARCVEPLGWIKNDK